MRYVDQNKTVDIMQLAADVAEAFEIPADGKPYDVAASLIKMPDGTMFVRHLSIQQAAHEAQPTVVEASRRG